MSILSRIARSASRALAVAALAAFAASGSPAACEPSNQASYHVLKKGETLYSVAKAYDISPDAIAKANSIGDASKLPAGMKLVIPRMHRVAKGETLYGIAKAYGVALDSLRAVNGYKDGAVIKPGDKLVIPAGAAAVGGAKAGSSAPGPAAADPAPAGKAPPPQAAPAGFPDSLRLSFKSADAKVSWPCSGDVSYLEGKAYGVLIKARLGESQKAVSSGTVAFADIFRGYGRVVMVASSKGYLYVYGGNESISVRAGDKVRSGQVLGVVGVDAKLGAPAAYFLVSKDGVAIDPAKAPRD